MNGYGDVCRGGASQVETVKTWPIAFPFFHRLSKVVKYLLCIFMPNFRARDPDVMKIRAPVTLGGARGGASTDGRLYLVPHHTRISMLSELKNCTSPLNATFVASR